MDTALPEQVMVNRKRKTLFYVIIAVAFVLVFAHSYFFFG